MYMIDSMIDMGLKENQEWISEAHREVAITIVIGNPNIKQRDILTEIVQAILKIPNDRIKTVTYKELVNEFNIPDVGMYV